MRLGFVRVLFAALLLSFSGASRTGAPAPAPAGPLAAEAASTPTHPTTVRLLVHFHADVERAVRDRTLAGVGASVDAEILSLGITRVTLAPDDDGWSALQSLAGDPAVLSVERDGTVRLAFTPNDALYTTDPYVQKGQWGIRKASVDKAWDLVRGSAQLTVATIDSGVDPNHPDLQGALVPGVAFISDPSAGCVVGAVNDDHGHGTHVAGIIAANGNNGVGIAGVAFGVKVLPIKALDCKGAGLFSDVARAITTATDRGARVINVSLGSVGDSSILHDAVRYATTRGALVVAAAGNCGIPGDCLTTNSPEYPAAYAEVLAVGATDSNDQRTSFSTQQNYVAIAAPGAQIVSLLPTYGTTLTRQTGQQGYGSLSGTSQASPFVAGVAALLLSEDPTLNAAQLRAQITSSADSLGQRVPNPAIGSGRVNAATAIRNVLRYGASYDVSGVPRSAAAGTLFPAPVRVGNTSGFIWPSTGTAPVHLSYHWLDAAGSMVTWEGSRTNLANDLAIGQTVQMSIAVIAPPVPGSYKLRVDVVLEGTSWFSSKGVATVDVPVGVTTGFNATYTPPTGALSAFAASGPGTLAVQLQNTGARAWPAFGPNPVHLSYHLIAADGSVTVWDGQRSNLPSDVQPGSSTTVTMALVTPGVVGPYTLRLDLVQEGIAWFSDQGVPPRDVAINVTSGFSAQYTLNGQVATLLPGGRVLVPVTLRNDGIAAWPAFGPTPVRLATHVYDGSGNTVIWDGERTNLVSDMAVGASASLNAVVNAPLAPGTYLVRLDLVREGIGWFSTSGARTLDVTVQVIADFRAGLPTTPLTISRGSPSAQVTVTNTGSATWTATGAAPVALSSHWLDASGAVLTWDGPRAQLGRDVAPGASVTVSVPLVTPPQGASKLVIDLVADGLQWFGAGSPRTVTLVP